MKNRLFVAVALIFSATALCAQVQNPEIIYYSRTTQSFDRDLPIGKDFQIKGTIPSDIVAVKVESLGFIGDIPATTDESIFSL